jgi:hypothetical protein
MRSLKFVAVALICAASSACQMPTVKSVPARLIPDKTNAACIMQMENAATGADGIAVKLTKAAFANSDVLSLSPPDVTGVTGTPANGRVRGGPDNFKLTLNNGRCLMTRENTGQVADLTACTCAALP